MTTKRIRMLPGERTTNILTYAVGLAEEKGFDKFTRAELAEVAGVSEGLISLYFNDMDGLRNAVMRAASRDNNHRIIAQGIAASHPVALALPVEIKRKALNTLV